jgi:hypothetical protein
VPALAKAFLMQTLAIAIIFSFPLAACAHSHKNPYACDKTTHELRAAEIQTLVKADQDDRKGAQITHETVARDKTRRMRLGEIFGEGCFQTAADFAAAALVYQHGNVPEHFFQAFIWAQRAVELGDPTQERLMGLALDRYLVNTGRKQLYASQASKPSDDGCWCLEPVEKTFPDSRRKTQTGKSLSQAFQWVDELNQNASCPAPKECEKPVADTPNGSIPGVW